MKYILVAIYNIIRNDRNRNGGGVIMYLKQLLSFSERNDLVVDSRIAVRPRGALIPNKPSLQVSWVFIPY